MIERHELERCLERGAESEIKNDQHFVGVNSNEVTPVPIPNTEVKFVCGDGTAGLTLWKSSTMPAFFCNPIS